jgi:poly-gamma-glutamate capsule biosynthesis protein CapA/YwtB (metallophosphatase superfamily)
LKPTSRFMTWSITAMAMTIGLYRPVAADDSLRVTLLGQSLIKVDMRVVAPGSIEQSKNYLPKDSVIFTNLEVAVAPPNIAVVKRVPSVQHIGPEVLDSLSDMGIQLLALSNNHALDLGVPGLLATIDELDVRGIAHAGAGEDLAAALAPGVLNRPEGRYALIGIASGGIQLSPQTWAEPQQAGVNFLEVSEDGSLNPVQHQRIIDAIRAAAQENDLLIVYHHNHYWGGAGAEPGPPLREARAQRFETPNWMRSFGREVIDAGAAIYVVHGNPALHGIELYKGRPLFYGLGNYIFHAASHPDRFGPLAYQSAAVEVEFAPSKILSEIRITPLLLTLADSEYGPRGTPYLAPSGDAEAILQRVAQLSHAYGTSILLEGREGVIRPSAEASSPAAMPAQD